MMKEFFKVTDLQTVLEMKTLFSPLSVGDVGLMEANRRVLAEDIVSTVDLPDFRRSVMDGYAVCASSTFGATESNPGLLTVKGAVAMGDVPGFHIQKGEAAKIATGGMLPKGADSVVMIEHVQALDDTVIEVYKSVPPGSHVIDIGDDIPKGRIALECGRRLRAQEIGLLAALGRERVNVYRRPVIAVISTGDEVVPVHETPGPGRIRDVNTYTLSSLIHDCGAVSRSFGIVEDRFESLSAACRAAAAEADMVLISGGSSVGVRDFTAEVFSALDNSRILVQGISISPGKPTILAKSGNKALWGLPGHVTSAMVVFHVVVRPFIEHMAGRAKSRQERFRIAAVVSRNIASAQGRIDYVRVRLVEQDGLLWAEPVVGKSGLIHTMVRADGLIEIGMNDEGLNRGDEVKVIPLK